MRTPRLVFTLVLLLAVPGLSPAETHRFIPQRFYTTFSGAHPPVLRIRPGDKVITKTVDAAGTDWDGKAVTTGPNPQTGPFYIEGAEPGDMLVVTIDKLEINRATAYSSSLLAAYTVDPAALVSRVDREPRRVTWTLDLHSIVGLRRCYWRTCRPVGTHPQKAAFWMPRRHGRFSSPQRSTSRSPPPTSPRS